MQSWEKGEATKPGTQGSGVRRPGVWEGGFKALERGRPMTFAENGRRKFENWNSAAQTTEGLQKDQKDTKSRPALLL